MREGARMGSTPTAVNSPNFIRDSTIDLHDPYGSAQ
jgi:hypothetical protein